jgi:hypothetical protein
MISPGAYADTPTRARGPSRLVECFAELRNERSHGSGLLLRIGGPDGTLRLAGRVAAVHFGPSPTDARPAIGQSDPAALAAVQLGSSRLRGAKEVGVEGAVGPALAGCGCRWSAVRTIGGTGTGTVTGTVTVTVTGTGTHAWYRLDYYKCRYCSAHSYLV